MSDSNLSENPPSPASTEERRERAAELLEKAIKYAFDKVMGEDLDPAERKAWANSLAYLASVLNAILKEIGKDKVGEEEGQDLVSILDKIPKRYLKPVRGGP